MTQDTGHLEISAKSEALYKHDLDTWKVSEFITDLSQIVQCLGSPCIFLQYGSPGAHPATWSPDLPRVAVHLVVFPWSPLAIHSI